MKLSSLFKQQPAPDFQKGDRVRVLKGAFTDFEGTVHEVSKRTVSLLFDMKGTPAVVDLHFDDVAKL